MTLGHVTRVVRQSVNVIVDMMNVVTAPVTAIGKLSPWLADPVYSPTGDLVL